ncbi:N-acetyllactosaminide 3-alpha-galactosyltransferase, partial [Ostertagia ostertagi]
MRQQLEEEQKTYGDVAIIENLEETYSNLALKTLRTMEYAYPKLPFPVDSDSFVRLGAFIKSLKDIQHPRLYWGFLDGRAKPFRKGKWREADWMLCDRYLPYQLGGGYALSYELARYLALNARLFKMYKNEDVSVGAWLAGLNVKYVHDPRFDTEWISRGCNNEYLITHKKSPADIQKLYNNMLNHRVLCEKEYRTRYSYVYDWTALPMFIYTLCNRCRIGSAQWTNMQFLWARSLAATKEKFKFVLDYLFLVVPGLLVMTVFSQSLLLLTCVLTTCLATLLVFIICEYLISPDRPAVKLVLNRIIDDNQQPTTFVTYFRATMLLSVATAILGVDFPSLLVASIVVRRTTSDRIRTNGFADRIKLSAACNGIWHSLEFFLHSSSSEGLFLSLFVHMVRIGPSFCLLIRTAHKSIRVKSWVECCWRLYIFSLIFYLMQLGAEWTLGQPSRRVVNIAYIFSAMSFLTFTLACFLCVQMFSIVAWAANVPHFST